MVYRLQFAVWNLELVKIFLNNRKTVNKIILSLILILKAMEKRLVKGEKKIFGVCSGLANYFEMDPTIMRAIFLVAFLIFGSGLLLYIILAIVMPDS
jgi:phage shock protein C